MSFGDQYPDVDSSFLHFNNFQSCFNNHNYVEKYFTIYDSIENFKRYNFAVGHIFWFRFFQKVEAIFHDYPTGTNHGYNHVRIGKVLRFFIFLSQTKDQVELYSNPKYELIWLCYWKMRTETVISTQFPSKNIDKIGCVQYLVYISSAVRSF